MKMGVLKKRGLMKKAPTLTLFPGGQMVRMKPGMLWRIWGGEEDPEATAELIGEVAHNS
jgi:hypothetical protein